MKFKAKIKNCHLFVRVKMSFGEEINDREFDFFSRKSLRGFLRPKQIRKHLIEFTGPVGISLQERLRKPITKREFLFIMEQIVLVIQKLQTNNLCLDKLVLDMQNVYINEVTKEVHFIYIPKETKGVQVNVIEFLEAIIYSAIPAQEQDAECISRFTYFLKGMNGFDAEEIEKYIGCEDKSIANTIRKQKAGQSGFMTDKPQHYYEHYENRESLDEATGLLEEEETALLSEEEEATGLLVDAQDEGTELLVENRMENTIENFQVNYPTLCRVFTEEVIRINKTVFRIGKDKCCVDYFVANNNAISRSHADIITRGGKYFVLDLNSKNHTFINECVIPVQCEIEIHDGDKLRLGDEEFIFRV